MSNGINYKNISEYWIKTSDYDFKTANSLFVSKKYPYCLFFCQLTIEKLLKAIIVLKTKHHAPFIHNLLRLAELTKEKFEDRILQYLAEITQFNIKSRYPEIKLSFYKKANKKYTPKYF